MRDTDESFEALFRDRLMSRSPLERLLMGFEMFDAARVMSEAGLASDDAAERRVELFERWYGDDFDEATRARVVARLRRVAARR